MGNGLWATNRADAKWTMQIGQWEVGKEKRKREGGDGKWAMKSYEKRAVGNNKREIVKK